MAQVGTVRVWLFRLTRAVIIGLAAVLTLLVLFAWLAGDRLIFFPSPATANWDTILKGQSNVREVTFDTADGTRLVSWHMAVEGARRTVLFFHGNGGNLSDRVDILQRFGRMETNVLVVGYPGYGRSAGRPSEAGLYAAAEAAWTWLQGEGVTPSTIVIYGESLGGGPAIELASRKTCAGLVVQSSFTSIRDMALHAIPVFPSHWFMKSRIDNLSRIGAVTAPKLFIATKRDEVIPFSQTQRLYEAASGPKTWVEFDDCGHNDLFWARAREWKAAISTFLRETAP